MKDFISLVKQQNSEIKDTCYFLPGEDLIGKTSESDLNSVIHQAVGMVDFVQSRPPKTHLFKKLCSAMDSQ
jgi:hypothetical protein